MNIRFKGITVIQHAPAGMKRPLSPEQDAQYQQHRADGVPEEFKALGVQSMMASSMATHEIKDHQDEHGLVDVFENSPTETVII
jgi:hypothetical protein